MLRLVAIMAKSVAQNQREFRQRLKEQNRYEEFKEKEKIRNRKRTALKEYLNQPFSNFSTPRNPFKPKIKLWILQTFGNKMHCIIDLKFPSQKK